MNNFQNKGFIFISYYLFIYFFNVGHMRTPFLESCVGVRNKNDLIYLVIDSSYL